MHKTYHTHIYLFVLTHSKLQTCASTWNLRRRMIRCRQYQKKVCVLVVL